MEPMLFVSKGEQSLFLPLFRDTETVRVGLKCLQRNWDECSFTLASSSRA